LIRVIAAAALALTLFLSCGNRPENSSAVSRPDAGEPRRGPESRPVPPATAGPAESIRIFPEISGAGTRLHLSSAGFDLGDGRIEWMVNGTPIEGRQEDSFPTGELRKGSAVQVRVRVGDRDLYSNVVTLVNSPPEIRSVRIVPEVVRPGDSIGVEAEGDDRDGDEVTFEYRWEKNGRPAGTGSRMEGPLRRDDSISVRITPFDGEVRGNFLVVRRDVMNYPPVIHGVFDAQLADDVYTGRVAADDGDGDPLSFALSESPPGMSIDPSTGAIRWTVPDGFVGSAPVAVTVSDGHGGETAYPFTLTIREELPEGPARQASKRPGAPVPR